MMFKKSTFQMTYIGEIFTKILVLPYVGRELNMIIMLPDENVSLETVRSAGRGGAVAAGPGVGSGAASRASMTSPPAPRPLPPREGSAGRHPPDLKGCDSLVLGGDRTHLREVHGVDEAGHAGRGRGGGLPAEV